MPCRLTISAKHEGSRSERSITAASLSSPFAASCSASTAHAYSSSEFLSPGRRTPLVTRTALLSCEGPSLAPASQRSCWGHRSCLGRCYGRAMTLQQFLTDLGFKAMNHGHRIIVELSGGRVL